MIPDRSEAVDVAQRDEQLLARVRARAKSAWVAAQQEDDLTRKAASEARLIASWPRPRVLPTRSFVLGAAAAACAAALAFAVLRSGEHAPATAAGASGQTASAAVVPSASASSVSVDSLPTARGVVFAGACPDCRIDGAALEPGSPLALGPSVSVPRGARLTLGFALPGALVDPTTGVDLEGPATASAPDEHSISLERGSARFRGLRDVTLSVPGARMVGEGATFTVSIDGHGVSHIAVEKGRVVVTSLTTAQARTVDAGTTLEVAPLLEAAPARLPSPSTTTPSAPVGSAPAAPETLDAVTSARTLFHDGEKAAARSQLEALVLSHDLTVSRRASFTLAEIEMASGERDKGRTRLLALATCPDARLAADASTLLARTEATPAGRAETWARYLQTSPPPEYRARALLERAEALFDAGRPQDANAILAELRELPLSDAHKRQLERLSYKTRNLR
jgi:hypothetical protein